MIRRWVLAALAVGTGGCATKGNVRQVETQVMVLRAETARQDSVRAAELARIIRLQQQVLDSLANTRQSIRVLDARFGTEITDLNRQLLAIQELTGQSQAELVRFRATIADRTDALAAAAAAAAAPPDTSGTAAAAPLETAPSGDQMYTGALDQYRRGSVAVARRAFLAFLQQYPAHPRVPDAQYWVAESFETSNPDSAVVRFDALRTRFPQSPRAPAALYKIGYIYEQVVKDPAKARAAYQRLLNEFPRSEEAELAKSRLASLNP